MSNNDLEFESRNRSKFYTSENIHRSRNFSSGIIYKQENLTVLISKNISLN